MKKYFATGLVIVFIGFIIGSCNNRIVDDENFEDQLQLHIEDSTPLTETQAKAPVFQEVNYEDVFQDIVGCAVFYDGSVFRVHNKELSQKPSSPYSTFKIVSALIGLEQGIIDSASSTMGYENTLYPVEEWNDDLTLKQAFRSSCIWYFKKIIDQAGRDVVQEALTDLHYGNRDSSDWEGSYMNPLADLNGFWLASSLQISPQGQVEVLRRIFDKQQTVVPKKNIDILKDIMYTDQLRNVSVYGKTGTGIDCAWFVGMAEQEATQWYFSVYLEGEDNQISGKLAKKIAMKIIGRYYIE